MRAFTDECPLEGSNDTMRHQHRSVALWMLLASTQALGATEETVHYDPDTHVFTLNSPHVTYAFGVNERGELQSLYWGGRRAPDDTLPAAKSDVGLSSFDPSTGMTPQEYHAWGSALYTEPALKVSFPDGNRDLVLHYLAHTLNGSHVSELLKDISRDVRVELRYDIDPDSGILARSAHIENHTGKSLFVQQAAAATWNLPSQVYVLYS